MHCGRFNFGYDIFDLSYSDPLNLNIYSSKHKAKYDCLNLLLIIW